MSDLDELVGQSPAIESVRRDLRRILGLVREGRRLPAILIQGETGTGKGLVAKLLHRHGPRSRGPFIDLNCAAIPEALLEGELFGYERGAFTDARRSKPGLFQASSGGMLFLDEVALLPESLQAKLLTAIEERAVRRLGGTVKEAFDAWLISATNTDLERAVRDRRFREDLYHRLAVLTIRLPPLRERGDDAALLAQKFLERSCHHYGLPPKSLTRAARALVARDPWPGNVRELGNVMERLALLVDTPDIGEADFDIARGVDHEPTPARAVPVAAAGGDEREQLLAALEATGWNIMRTAGVLGVSRNTMRARMDRWGLRAGRAAGARPGPLTPAPASSPMVATAPVEAPPAAVRWERRHVTMLRVALAETADASLYGGHLLSLAADKVRGFGGRLEGLGRTQLDASFGAVPIDNAARRAASAALAVHKAIAEVARPDVGAATVIHTEQTTVGQAGSLLVIDEVDRAVLAGALDRLSAHARPGVVRVSATAAPFLARHFELGGAEEAEGAAGPSFIVLRPDPTGLGAWRRLARFVGRETEMGVLSSRWELARSGRGQVVGLVGEPGVGKSRVVLEFMRSLDASAARVLHMATTATEAASRRQGPAATLVRGLFAIEPGDGPPEIRDKLAARLETLGLDAKLRPPLAALLDVDPDDAAWAQLDPPQRVRRTLDALRRLIVRESIARPVVVVLEDLQWIDADTQAALDQLIDMVPTARILFVVAYRPEYRHDWASRSFYTQVRIDPLPVAAATLLLDDLLGTEPDIEPLKPLLLSWTEGNPFFLEEAVRTLVETGGLDGVPGAYRLTGAVVARPLPATVEDTLAERIHRLPADARHVLRCGAVVGIEFTHAVLTALAELPENALAACLRALEDAEFVYPVVGAPTPTHTFKHDLTHLVAYRSVPPERQRTLHRRVLSALETLHAGQLDAHVETLAAHALRAEMWDRAASYLQAAGKRALARSATQTAVDHLERAVGALDRAERRRDLLERAIDVRLDLRYALTLLGRPEQALPRLQEAEAIAAELGDTRRRGRVVSFLANGLYLLGDHAGAIAAARRATELARQVDDLPTRVTADIYAGRALHALGRFDEATELFRGVVEALSGERANEYAGLPVLPAAYARSYLALGLTELGDFASALTAGREAVAVGDATGHPDTIQWACYALGVAMLGRGDVDAAIGLLERALSICRTAELPVYVARAAAALGHAYTLAGRPGGVALLEAAATDSEAISHRNVQATILARLAEVYVLTGRVHEAAEQAVRSLALARERGERGSEAHALCMLAVAYEAQSRSEDSRASYEAALALASDRHMRPLAALCHLGLGRLERGRGGQAEAARHLTLAHETFQSLEMASRASEASTELALLG